MAAIWPELPTITVSPHQQPELPSISARARSRLSLLPQRRGWFVLRGGFPVL